MVAAMFLVLSFHVETGVVRIIHGNEILVVANHRAIRARVTEDVELLDHIVVGIVRRGVGPESDFVVTSSYSPRKQQLTNLAYLGFLDANMNLSTDTVRMNVSLYYLDGRLVAVNAWRESR